MITNHRLSPPKVCRDSSQISDGVYPLSLCFVLTSHGLTTLRSHLLLPSSTSTRWLLVSGEPSLLWSIYTLSDFYWVLLGSAIGLCEGRRAVVVMGIFSFRSSRAGRGGGGEERRAATAAVALAVLVLVALDPGLSRSQVEAAIGVNWGALSGHKLSPKTVVRLLKDNRISKVKLFDADPEVVKSLSGSGIQVMVGIPNDMLSVLSSSAAACDLWVRQNISAYLAKNPRDGVDIRYVAVGNEPFLTTYSGQYQSFVMPALLNLQQSLVKANLAGYVKLVVPCNADAYESSLPSQGAFRADLAQIMGQLVSFLNSNGSPFVVNIYPFLSLYGNSDFPQDYAFFEGTNHPVTDGANVYDNAFDGNFDTLVAALNRIGYGQMPIVIGEIGWPTDGAVSANLTAARVFNQGLIKHVLSNKGTPLRPGSAPMDVYLFSLLDEGAKSILPGTFERHWGIFSFDGQAKYQLNLGLGNGLLKNARDVDYLPTRWCVADPTKDLSSVANHYRLACSAADCTTLNYGGSCNAIGAKGNISYAFNSYYQVQKQDAKSCDFDGLGMITFLDPSVGNCHFLVGITDTASVSCRLLSAVWITFCAFLILLGVLG